MISLECGGSTPPSINRSTDSQFDIALTKQSARVPRRHDDAEILRTSSPANMEGGVEPPHSRANHMASSRDTSRCQKQALTRQPGPAARHMVAEKKRMSENSSRTRTLRSSSHARCVHARSDTTSTISCQTCPGTCGSRRTSRTNRAICSFASERCRPEPDTRSDSAAALPPPPSAQPEEAERPWPEPASPTPEQHTTEHSNATAPRSRHSDRYHTPGHHKRPSKFHKPTRSRDRTI